MDELFIRVNDEKKAGRVCLVGDGRDSALIDRAPYFRQHKRQVGVQWHTRTQAHSML